MQFTEMYKIWQAHATKKAFCCHVLHPTGNWPFWISGQQNLKTFTILNCEAFQFSWNAVVMVRWTICMFRHETGGWCNPTVYCPTCPKFNLLDKRRPEDFYIPTWSHSHSATYWQPTNRNLALCDKHHPIYMKFTLCGLHLIYNNIMQN